MEFETLLQKITPESHGKLRQVIEIGKWVDGTPLTGEQRELCMQAMIAWEARNLPEEERAGYMGRSAGACGSACATPVGGEPGAVHVVRATDLVV